MAKDINIFKAFGSMLGAEIHVYKYGHKSSTVLLKTDGYELLMAFKSGKSVTRLGIKSGSMFNVAYDVQRMMLPEDFPPEIEKDE